MRTLKGQFGRSTSKWSYRIGEVEELNGEFVIRLYAQKAETLEEQEKPVTTLFAVVRGVTEEQCLARGDHIFRTLCQGDFEDY